MICLSDFFLLGVLRLASLAVGLPALSNFNLNIMQCSDLIAKFVDEFAKAIGTSIPNDMQAWDVFFELYRLKKTYS